MAKELSKQDKILVDRIEEQRIKKGLTKKALAELLKLPQSTISEWQSGRQSPITHIGEIADELHVDVNYLLGRTDSPNIEPDNFTPDNLRSDLVIPDILKQVGIGFSGGAENLTQEDIDNMALALEIGRRNKEY